jgi:hypothetical protein
MGHDFSISKLNRTNTKKQTKTLMKNLRDYKLQIKNEFVSEVPDMRGYSISFTILTTDGKIVPFKSKNIKIEQTTVCHFPSQSDKKVYEMFHATHFDAGVSGINDGKLVNVKQVHAAFKRLNDALKGTDEASDYQNLIDFYYDEVVDCADDQLFFIHYS